MYHPHKPRRRSARPGYDCRLSLEFPARFTPLNLRNIPAIVQRAGEGFQPCFHFALVDACDAHAFNAAPEFAGVLRGDHDAIFHYADFDGHAVDKSGLGEPFSAEVDGAAFYEGVELAVGEVWYGSCVEGVSPSWQPPINDIFSLIGG